MRLESQRRHRSYVVKLALVAVVAALGDYLVWQLGQWGGVQGLFGFGLIGAVLLARPAVRHDRRALAALALAALYALAELRDPSVLAFALFWIAMGLAHCCPAPRGSMMAGAGSSGYWSTGSSQCSAR